MKSTLKEQINKSRELMGLIKEQKNIFQGGEREVDLETAKQGFPLAQEVEDILNSNEVKNATKQIMEIIRRTAWLVEDGQYYLPLPSNECVDYVSMFNNTMNSDQISKFVVEQFVLPMISWHIPEEKKYSDSGNLLHKKGETPLPYKEEEIGVVKESKDDDINKIMATMFQGLTSVDKEYSKALYDCVKDNAKVHGITLNPKVIMPSSPGLITPASTAQGIAK